MHSRREVVMSYYIYVCRDYTGQTALKDRLRELRYGFNIFIIDSWIVFG